MVALSIVFPPPQSHGAPSLRQEFVDDFVAWHKAHGALMDYLEVFVSDTGYGVRATRPIHQDETFVRVPVALSLNEHQALKSPVLGPIIQDQYANKNSNVTWTPFGSLALMVFHEALYAEQSFWAPYLRLLPASFPGHPYFLTPDELRKSNASTILSDLRLGKQSAHVEEMSNAFIASICVPRPELYGPDTPSNRLTWEAQWKWAITIVTTRAYSPRFEGDVITLVPTLDLLNHQNFGSLSYIDIEPSPITKITHYAKRATMDYQIGDEVWAAYARSSSLEDEHNCNHNLYLTWGFTLNTPESHCVRLFISYIAPEVDSTGDPESNLFLTATLDRLGIIPRDTQSCIMPLRESNTMLPPKLMQVFRMFYGQADEVALEIRKNGTFANALSLTSEFLTLRAVLQTFKDRMSGISQEVQNLSSMLPADPEQWTAAEVHFMRITQGQLPALERGIQLARKAWGDLLDAPVRYA